MNLRHVGLLNQMLGSNEETLTLSSPTSSQPLVLLDCWIKNKRVK